MENYQSYLTLRDDINQIFGHLIRDDVSINAKICDGDMKLLDKAVKKFKTQVWENQLD